jgi:hypothetical protein
LRAKENLLARERSVHCSAFVQRLFLNVGVDLVPGVTGKNTTPEDIARTLAPHVACLLQRTAAPGKLAGLKRKIRVHICAGRGKLL